jgi:organic hydroperoxide reductase OsmC/OhrA
VTTISARVQNSHGQHEVMLQTNDGVHSITIPPKATGFGSSANGGELLFLALATCYCNDIYREAAKRGIQVTNVDVTVEGDFGAEGQPARSVMYSASVSAHAKESDIQDLMRHTDTVAEIQNTLRIATPVTLKSVEAIAVQP